MKIAVIPGSLRKESYNKKIARIISDELESLGVDVDFIDLNEVNLPVYNQDNELDESLTNFIDFRQRMKDADGFVICTPEYNHSFPGGLKNAIDWASRGGMKVMHNKHVALAGATSGAGGTIRAQIALLPILRAMGSTLLTRQVHISFVHKLFDENGNLTDEKTIENLKALAKDLVEKS